MSVILRQVLDSYNFIFEELPSPITKGWFLTAKPYQIVILLILYYNCCTKWGPRLMKNRKPFDLTNVLLAYNISQIAVNAYILVLAIHYVFLSGEFDFRCQTINSEPDVAKYVAGAMWLYFMLKVTELLDTAFFVLRKSYRQISRLHLHHHILMVVSTWFGTTYYPGGQGILIGALNSLVHIIMYGYYLIAGLGENYKKYLWWKKYVTIVQIVQFLIIALHHTHSLFYECGYPLHYKLLTIVYAIYFTNMFSQFYFSSYIRTKTSKTK